MPYFFLQWFLICLRDLLGTFSVLELVVIRCFMPFHFEAEVKGLDYAVFGVVTFVLGVARVEGYTVELANGKCE